MTNRRVVITGLGALSAAGEGIEALWSACENSKSGIVRVDLKDLSNSKTIETDFFGGKIPDFDAEKYVTNRKSLKVMARDIQLAVAGASLAVRDSGILDMPMDRFRFGTICGSGVLDHEIEELAYSIQSSLDPEKKLDLKKFGEDGLHSLFPLWLLKYLPNMPACHISILFDLQGPNNTLTTGASSGLQAIGEAFYIIQRGSADAMVAGASDSKLNPLGVAHYQILGALAQNGNTDKYRSFDAESQGLLVGEASAFLLLEELEHAKKRGAKIYAEVLSFGSSCEEGSSIALKRAVDDGRVTADHIDYIQSTGLGMKDADEKEALAIEKVFAGCKPVVGSCKAVTGFSGFASGAVDAALSALAVEKQRIPKMHKPQRQARKYSFNLASENLPEKSIRHAMTHSFGFGAPAAAMVLKAWEK